MVGTCLQRVYMISGFFLYFTWFFFCFSFSGCTNFGGSFMCNFNFNLNILIYKFVCMGSSRKVIKIVVHNLKKKKLLIFQIKIAAFRKKNIFIFWKFSLLNWVIYRKTGLFIEMIEMMVNNNSLFLSIYLHFIIDFHPNQAENNPFCFCSNKQECCSIW